MPLLLSQNYTKHLSMSKIIPEPIVKRPQNALRHEKIFAAQDNNA